MGGSNPKQTQGMITGGLIGGPIGAVIGNNPKMIGMNQDQFNQDLIGGAVGGLGGVGVAEAMRRNPSKNQQPQVGITTDQMDQLRKMGLLNNFNYNQ